MSFGGSTNEEYVLKMIVRDEELKRLNAEIAKEEAALKALIASLGNVTTAQLQANAAVQAHAASLAALNAQQNALGNSTRQSRQQFLNLGRTLDDMQYVGSQGLRPIINNVMEMAPALGIAMIGVQLLWSNWSTLEKLWGGGGTKSEADRMEELGKKTEKTAEELAKLLRYKEREATMNAQASGKSGAEKGQAHGVNAAVDEADDKAIVKGLAETQRQRLIQSDEEASRMDRELKHRLGVFHGASNKEWALNNDSGIKALKEKLDSKVDEQARKLMADAANDPGKLKTLQAMIRANPKAFGAGGADLLKNLDKASPEGQADEAFRKDSEWAERESRKKDQQRAHQAVKDEDADAKKFRDDNAWAANKLKQDDHKHDQEALTAAKDTGIGKMLADQFEAQFKLNGAIDTRGLRESMAARFGQKTGDALLKDAEGDARKGVMQDFIKGHKPKHSETISAADYGKAIRESGQKDEKIAEKQLGELIRTRVAMEKILAQPKPKPGVFPN